MNTELSDKWVRAFVGATAVVDTRAPVLFWEDSFPVPGYAFARSDVRTDLLHPNPDGPAGMHGFFRPKGPVTQWFDLEVETDLPTRYYLPPEHVKLDRPVSPFSLPGNRPDSSLA